MKKILSMALCATLVASSTVSAFAFSYSGEHALYIDEDSNSAETTLIPGEQYIYEIRRKYNGGDRSVDRDIMGDLDYEITVTAHDSDYDDDDLSVTFYRSGDEYFARVRTSSSLEDENASFDVLIETFDDDQKYLGESTMTFDVDGEYDYTNDGDDLYVYDGETILMEFDSDVEDVHIEYDDYAIYEGEFTGSRKKEISFNTEEDDDIIDDHYYADLEFYSFDGLSLDGGQLTFFTSMEYIYEITSSGLVEVNGRFYDDDEELILRTDNPGDYVLSDEPLRDTIDEPETEPDEPTSDDSSTSTPSAKGEVDLSASVIDRAPRTSNYAIVGILNGQTTSGADLVAAGKELATGERLILRYVSGNAVQYQWYIDAKNAAAASANFELGLTANYEPTEEFFAKYFSNNIEVLRMEHNGAIGINTNIAVKMDLNGMNTATLRAYHYNPTTNVFTAMPNANVWVDSANYVHLTINTGGDILITDTAIA